MGFDKVDLSEMYIVRFTYFDKARNYYLRQGKANFSQGSLSHDVINVIKSYGIVKESLYPGRMDDQAHNHEELEKELKEYLDSAIESKDKSPLWMAGVNKILDKHLGVLPRGTDGVELASFFGINPTSYMSFTSFTHHPMYESFILEIPDNYSNGSYMNVEMKELRTIVDHALANGYTVSWDGDVSENGFRAKEGYAVLSTDKKINLAKEYKQTRVDANLRQNEFMTYTTTDDHLMHIVGRIQDEKGRTYYKVKNSWGKLGPYDGYLYMTEAYFDMKTVGILVNTDAVPGSIKSKFK